MRRPVYADIALAAAHSKLQYPFMIVEGITIFPMNSDVKGVPAVK